MFEAKFHKQGTARPLDHAEEADGGLRPVSWSDLVAKLDAARDLRIALHGLDEQGEGSFNPSCARHIAALGDGKQGVNLDALADGKAPSGMANQHVERGADSVRGN
ncbi:hypothetical protein [Croceibacterium aestuarii]|uniref:hypothetical protein n=1 Tax=Croceibacterium aestuarii TaxID=3064139 RepID=UPI00272E67F1|nr:hypothetical protein [Croceibacterium sp. D39]